MLELKGKESTTVVLIEGGGASVRVGEIVMPAALAISVVLVLALTA